MRLFLSLPWLSVYITALFLSLSCTTVDPFFKPKESRSREDFVARAKRGMVATDHPLASEAGLQMLKKGGNAMDAAVAASFAISVVRPQSTGIGGGGFLLYFDATQNDTMAYDFRERAPIRATQDMFMEKNGKAKDFIYNGIRIPKASVNGHLSVGTPGLVAGLVETHKKHGLLPLASVMQPAIDLAEKGFLVYPALVEAIKFRLKVLKNFPATSELFLPGGVPLKAGDLLVQKDLANTLKLIAQKGKAGFYQGDVAEKLIEEMKGFGILGQDDLNEYQVKQRKPLTGNYRDHKIISMPPPSSGGVHIIQILNMLAEDKISEYGPYSSEFLHLLAEAMKRAFADRAKYLGDPDFVHIPIAGLISPRYALDLRKTIKAQMATPAKALAAGYPAAYESASTAHISVVDQWSNAVSTTQTINYIFGSGVIAKGTGVLLNDEMDDFSKSPGVPNVFGLVGSEANAITAKKTMLSSMSPTIVLDNKGRVKLIVGAKGGPRIITSTLQTIINVIDFRMSLADAVHTKRIHHQWLPDTIYIENDGVSHDSGESLKEYGHELSPTRKVGSVQAILQSADGWVGVADVRSTGKPMGLD